MALFHKKKKEKDTCCCGDNFTPENMAKAQAAKAGGAAVKILGSGCAKCDRLEAAVREAFIKLGRKDSIEHVSDYEKIAAYGVMTTPALVVDGKVVSYGKVLTPDEVINILR